MVSKREGFRGKRLADGAEVSINEVEEGKLMRKDFDTVLLEKVAEENCWESVT